MQEIISKIETLKEDKPELIITKDLIKQYIEDNLEALVKEIEDLLAYIEAYRNFDFFEMKGE